MATVTLTGTTLGADVGPFNIYHTSEVIGNLLESGVSRATLDAGWQTSQIYNLYIVRSTGVCTNAVNVPLGATPTPTATATPTPTPTATAAGPTPTPTATPVPSYYELRRCSDDVAGFRSAQTIVALPGLGTNDRVQDASLVNYIILGSTPTGNSVGNITDTGLQGCPAAVRYYNMSLCSDPNVQFVGVNNSGENLANGSSLENNGVCYQVGTETTTSGLDTNITSWTRYNTCAACFAVNPTPTPTPTATAAPTPTPTPTSANISYNLSRCPDFTSFQSQGYAPGTFNSGERVEGSPGTFYVVTGTVTLNPTGIAVTSTGFTGCP